MKRLLGTLAVAALAMTVLPAGPAAAAIGWYTTWADPVDATAGADIRKVTESTGAQQSVRADVRDLGAQGTYRVVHDARRWRVVVVVSKTAGQAPRAGMKYAARNPDGSLGAWQYLPGCGPVMPSWNAQVNVVGASYRLDCREEFSYEGDLAYVSLAAGGNVDTVRTAPKAPVALGSERFSDARGDAAARADIRATTHTLTEGALWAHTRVADVRGEGRYRLFLHSERAWNMRVVVTKAAGQAPVATLLVEETPYDGEHTPWHRVPCNMRLVWDARANVVNVQVPRRCHDGLADLGPAGHYTSLRAVDFTSAGATDRLRLG